MTSTDDGPRTSRAGVVPARAGFIVGVPRSGTTLLVSLLDGHPDALVLPFETKVLEWCGADDPVTAFLQVTGFARAFKGAPGQLERFNAELRSRLPGPADHGRALAAVVEALQAARPVEGAHIWIEKTPKHLRSLPLLLDRFGHDSPVAVVVRDPRAVFASQGKRWRREGVLAVRRFACRWAIADEMTRQFVRDYPAVAVVRYEDLVLDPEPHVRRLAGHFGLGWHECLRSTSRMGRPFTGNSSFGERTSQVSRAPLERWRTHLSPEEVAKLEELLGPAMRRHGYELTGTSSASARSWHRRRMEITARYRLLQERRRWRRRGVETSA